jgi:Flp pilus assembly pilin Flp
MKNIVGNLRTFVLGNQHHDLIEYALMAGFVIAGAGAILPGLSDSISAIFSTGASIMTVTVATS